MLWLDLGNLHHPVAFIVVVVEGGYCDGLEAVIGAVGEGFDGGCRCCGFGGGVCLAHCCDYLLYDIL